MSGVVHECLVCREQFKTAKEHLMHLPSHPELVGRGRTRSRTWSCWRCATQNYPESDTCSSCGWKHPNATKEAS